MIFYVDITETVLPMGRVKMGIRYSFEFLSKMRKGGGFIGVQFQFWGEF